MAEAAGRGRAAGQRPPGARRAIASAAGGGARPRPVARRSSRAAPSSSARSTTTSARPRPSRRCSRSCAAVNRADGRRATGGRRPAARDAPRAGGAARHARPRGHRSGSGRPASRTRSTALLAAARGGARRAATSPAPTRCATASAGPGLRDHRHRRTARRSTRTPGVSASGVSREVVYGRNPVRELIAAGAPPGARGLGARLSCAAEPWLAGVPVVEHTRAELGRLAGSSRPPGRRGAHRALPYAEPARPAGAPRAPSSCLDGAQDPRNLGAIARVAEASGAAGLAHPAPREPRGDPDRRQGLGRGRRAPARSPGRQRGRLRPRRPRRGTRWPSGADPEGGEDYRDLAWPRRPRAGDGSRGRGAAAAGAGRLRPPRPHPHVGARGLAQHLRGGRRSCSSRAFRNTD